MANSNIDQKSSGSDHGKVFFSWQFDEFIKHARDKNWYIKAGLAVGVLLLYSIFAHNYIFGLITIIAALTITLFHRSDNKVEFSITEDGIIVNKKFYDYKDLQNFYIIYQPPAKTLYFELKNVFSPRIPIALESQDPVKVRKVLLEYLEEDLTQEDEPLSDQASRLFKLWRNIIPIIL